MPTFTFTSPDGKSYDVQGPDGATKEQAFGILQQRLGGAPKPEAAPQGLSALPPSAGAPQNAVDPHKEVADDIAHKVLGIGEAGASLATGAVAGPIGAAYGAGKALTSGKLGTQAGVAEGEKAGSELTQKLTYQPKTQTGKEAAGAIGSALDESKLAGLPVEGSVLNQIGKVPRAAAEAEGALKAAPKAIARAAIDKLPGIDPETAQLAKDAHSMGFRLTPDQVIGGKYAKALGEGAASIPLSGSNTKLNRQVFNQQLVKQIGGEGDKLTRKTFADAMKKSGQTIGDVAEKTEVPLTSKFLGGLRESAAETSKYQTSDVSRAVNNYLDEIVDKSVGGVLPGKALRTISTKIGNQIRSTQNGDLKFALSDIQDQLHDAMTAGLSKEDRATLATARKQYAVGKTLEPLIAKAPTGDIPPSQLLGAITANKAGKSAVAKGAAGDLGKLADIGQRFLKEQPSSGTAERSWAQGIPATLGGLAGGTAGAAGAGAGAAGGLAAAYGAANLYNRVGPAVTQQLIDRPPR